jgi:DNA polymerase I-like protein with 3'-5' exonuclease and polymerase domains
MTPIKVTAIRKIARPPVVHDITVEDNHNLYVRNEISQTPILAHNCLDENIKQLQKHGTAQYNLGQIARNYGITWYDTADFGKDDRHTIRDRPLDHAVLSYCAADVQAPFAIQELQLARARALKHQGRSYEPTFRRFVVTQMNNLVKIESYMEGRGVYVDSPWLRQLQLKTGPLEKLKAELTLKLRESKMAQRANAKMMEAKGIPKNSLWGNSQWVLDLNKPADKQCLFIDVLGLEPIAHGKNGAPSINKFFLAKYKETPDVATFSEVSGLEKLGNTYVSKFARLRREDPDMKADGRLRPSFGFTDTVTGRSNSYDPSLQQIPSRGKHAKLIKKLFIAEPGKMLVKMDYSAHEIRVWSIISGDEKLGALFQQGRDLRQKWRATEKEKYKDLLDSVGDIHKLNCQLFFGTDPKEVTKEQRDAVKSLVFGSIYGMGPGTLANNLKRDKQFVIDLLEMFFKRYSKASAWLKASKQHAIDHNYVQSPPGRRRNMYAHLYEGAGALEAAAKRMASNSPIQGWSADMAHTAATLFLYHFPRVVEAMQLGPVDTTMGGISVMVHDSIEGDFRYDLWLVALQVMQWCATRGCMNYYEHHFGIKFTVPLEVEFELGPDDASLEKWDWSRTSLDTIIETSFVNQKLIFADLDIKAAKKQLLAPRNNKKLMSYLDKHYPILA